MSVQRISPVRPQLRVVGGTDVAPAPLAPVVPLRPARQLQVDTVALVDWRIVAKVALFAFGLLALFAISFIVFSAMLPGTGHTVSYTAAQGDTLWSIASKFASGRPVADVVGLIREANGIYSDALMSGQSLLIPVP